MNTFRICCHLLLLSRFLIAGLKPNIHFRYKPLRSGLPVIGSRIPAIVGVRSRVHLRSSSPLGGLDPEELERSASEIAAITKSPEFNEGFKSLPIGELDKSKELQALHYFGLYFTDNYYETTLPTVMRMREEAIAVKNYTRLAEIDEMFNNLSQSGVYRRWVEDIECSSGEAEAKAGIFGAGVSIAKVAAMKAMEMMKRSMSTEEQLKAQRLKELAQKAGPIFEWALKRTPRGLHKYIKYLRSLRCAQSSGEVFKNTFISACCALFVLSNNQPRKVFQLYGVGLGVSLSMLVARNMPGADKKTVPGQPPPTSYWSTNSFYTAAAITILLGGGSALLALPLMLLLPGSVFDQVRYSMAISLLVNAYFSTFFECFEPSSQNGIRWTRSEKGLLSEAEEQQLQQQVHEALDLHNDHFDEEYDPNDPKTAEQEEAESRPFLIDVQQAMATGSGDQQSDLSRLMHAIASERASRFPSTVVAAPQTKPAPRNDLKSSELGVKDGFLTEDVPDWLSEAYEQSVPKWERLESKKVGQNAEAAKKAAAPIVGPFGFRDKVPAWLSEVLKESSSQPNLIQKFSRDFGTYRRAMWKKDPGVVRRASDGGSDKALDPSSSLPATASFGDGDGEVREEEDPETERFEISIRDLQSPAESSDEQQLPVDETLLWE